MGGLVTGLRGAWAAASAVLRQGNYRKELRHLRRELGLHFLMRSVLNSFGSQDYDRLLDLLDRRTTRLLGHCTRDEMSKTCWRLIMTQPRLLSFAARLLFSRGG